MQNGFWFGFGMAFAAIGAVVVTAFLVWAAIAVGFPKGIWWTIKRLPVQDKLSRAKAAGLVGGARRAYVLRIPYGLRIIVALGGTYDQQYNAKEVVLKALVDADPYDEHEGTYSSTWAQGGS